MIINLNEIIIKQDELDREILLNSNTNYSDTFNERKLAILVELGELSNEIRSFKYWSVKSGSESCVILEEYVDTIHFISGFCVQYQIAPTFEIPDNIRLLAKKEITKKINKLFKLITKLKENKNNVKIIKKFYKKYLEFGYGLGYTIEDIKNAYDKKNLINHTRQDNKY
ncbi:MAG: dUTP diphosphatase [Mycoplasmataceae bacterium]|nr:dUTP diphosphatase [Mycoplasmataceae bacterium]